MILCDLTYDDKIVIEMPVFKKHSKGHVCNRLCRWSGDWWACGIFRMVFIC